MMLSGVLDLIERVSHFDAPNAPALGIPCEPDFDLKGPAISDGGSESSAMVDKGDMAIEY
jgi:hypothetical protein